MVIVSHEKAVKYLFVLSFKNLKLSVDGDGFTIIKFKICLT
jgi:hypothetical protein